MIIECTHLLFCFTTDGSEDVCVGVFLFFLNQFYATENYGAPVGK